MLCPECGCSEVRRTRRANLLERIWSWIGIWPYWCFGCSTRYFQPYMGEGPARPKYERRAIEDHRTVSARAAARVRPAGGRRQEDLEALRRSVESHEARPARRVNARVSQ